MPFSEDILNAKILIVDDNVDNLDLLAELLESQGYTSVTRTTEPAEVCELHEEKNFDLILLDMQMPGMHGFDVMKCLKEVEVGGYIPVLAISAQPSFNIAALEAGARDFISKPFDFLELNKRIHNMLEVRLLYKQLAEFSKIQSELALHDPLTGLPNRRLLEDRIETTLRHASRNHTQVAVMYLDLDGFKGVNDTHGHHAGDELLKVVSNILLGNCRREDTVARLGGDEFMVLLSEVHDLEDAKVFATKIIEAVSAPLRVLNNVITISTSVGISIYPGHGENAEELIINADNALYEAKRNGKNQFCIAKV